jgi:hypothetical protein
MIKKAIVAVLIVPMVVVSWLFGKLGDLFDDAADNVDESSTKFGNFLVKKLKIKKL